MLSAYLSEEYLEDEKHCALWNPIFTQSAVKLARHYCDSILGRYNSTRELLTDYPGKKENVAYRTVRAAMDDWLG